MDLLLLFGCHSGTAPTQSTKQRTNGKFQLKWCYRQNKKEKVPKNLEQGGELTSSPLFESYSVLENDEEKQEETMGGNVGDENNPDNFHSDRDHNVTIDIEDHDMPPQHDDHDDIETAIANSEPSMAIPTTEPEDSAADTTRSSRRIAPQSPPARPAARRGSALRRSLRVSRYPPRHYQEDGDSRSVTFAVPNHDPNGPGSARQGTAPRRRSLLTDEISALEGFISGEFTL